MVTDLDDEDTQSYSPPTISESLPPTIVTLLAVSPSFVSAPSSLSSPSNVPVVVSQQAPTLLEHWAMNLCNNAGIPPREWWKTWEPTTWTSATWTDEVPSDNNKTEHLTCNGPDLSNSDVNKNGEDTATTMSTCYANPQSLKEAMECPDACMAVAGSHKCQNEIHFENGMSVYVEAPPYMNIVSCKWVFYLKCHTSRSIEQYKGFTQCPGFKYTEGSTFSPVYCPASPHLILTLAAKKNLHLHSIEPPMLSYLGKTSRKSSTCNNLKVSIMAVQTHPASCINLFIV